MAERLKAPVLKTADVAAHVRAAGESHTENRINIELDRAPVRQIVAAPDLRIALDAGKSRAVDDIRTLLSAINYKIPIIIFDAKLSDT